jgi:HK97 family phage major capsid protein
MTTQEITSPELKHLEAEIHFKRENLRTIFDEAGPERTFALVKSIGGSNEDKVAEVRRLNDELQPIVAKAAGLRAALAIAQDLDENPAPTSTAETGANGRKAESFGERFVKSEACRNFGQKSVLDVDLKTLMSRTAGWAPESFREPGFVPIANAPIMVLDLMPTLPTKQAAVKYMEQTTRTNNAAERAEGAVYGEAAFVLAETSKTVETVGIWLPVTDEELEDVESAAAMIDLELPTMLRQRVDLQVLVGNGTTPNLQGVNNQAGIQTQAKGSDPGPDAIFKAMTKVRVTGRAMASGVVLHPNNWQDIRLLRTVDGIYIWGSPSDPAPETIWGLRVAQSDNQTLGTGLVGDFASWARLYLRRDVTVERTNSHSTDFINGRQAIRASIRCAMVWKRPAAFATVTGL